MSEKLYPSLRKSDALDKGSLNIRLKEIKSFNNSIQNTKDVKSFYNLEAKNIKINLKHIKL